MNQQQGEGGYSLKKIGPVLTLIIVFSLILTVVVTWKKGWRREDLKNALQRGGELQEQGATRRGEKKIRQPVVAGKFYPEEAGELRDMVAGMMGAGKSIGLRGVRAILVPHAGYVYSGEVAAAAFREVSSGFRRVFLLAANHSGEEDFAGLSLPDVAAYGIPGHEIPLGAEADDFSASPLFKSVELAHTMHMIEVELPFLQHLRGWPENPDYVIIPMILGKMAEGEIRELAGMLLRYADAETLFVFSVDLSHYYPDEEARKLDGYTMNALLSQDQTALSRAVTDGNHVLGVMLELARLKGWEPTHLMYRNSGDVSGDRGRVVGYGAIAFHEPLRLSGAESGELLRIARGSIAQFLETGRVGEPDAALLEKFPVFQAPRAVFVTLKKNGRLRGCIGDLVSYEPLHENVRQCAVRAATQDSRFSPVSREELDELTLSISMLEYPRQVQVPSPAEYAKVLRPGEDGVILMHRGKRSTFLPYVWEELPEPQLFLAQLCLKQGSPAACWRDTGTTLYRYGAYEFGEGSAP